MCNIKLFHANCSGNLYKVCIEESHKTFPAPYSVKHAHKTLLPPALGQEVIFSVASVCLSVYALEYYLKFKYFRQFQGHRVKVKAIG